MQLTIRERIDLRTGLSIEEIRAKLSSWHFSQEMLTREEREILRVAEATLRLLDEQIKARS